MSNTEFSSAFALSTFPSQHHPISYGQADRVKALLTRSSDEIERFQRDRVKALLTRSFDEIERFQRDRVKALLTRSSDEIERFQRESFPFPGKHDSIAYC
jgi:excinuclease UvrABC nuclease subunit